MPTEPAGDESTKATPDKDLFDVARGHRVDVMTSATAIRAGQLVGPWKDQPHA